MKVSYNTLKRYVEFDWSPAELAERLTMCGIEVEGIETRGGGLDKVVVAQIESFEQHPNADRLSVCRVNDGKQIRQIVCGAKNFKAGDKVPLAQPGANLPTPDGKGFVIKESKLRGVESQGMLCSPEELRLNLDVDGLWILSPAVQIGTPISEIIGFDTIYDLEITPNRPDLLSFVGLAREISAVNGNPVKYPASVLPKGSSEIHHVSKVTVEDPELCPRYTARVIKGIAIKPGPDWLVDVLAKSGVRAINNIVDVTNFVMLELGQPLHAFDFNLLAGKQIVVRRARDGEVLMTLDGKERKLSRENLVIADAEKAVALAGVMGGQSSEINPATVDVLLESATFHPSNIRSTAKTVGLGSESSYRFERKVDPALAEVASQRAASLILELAGGTLVEGVIDTWAGKPVPLRIPLRYQRANRLLGVDVAAPDVKKILTGLGIAITGETSEGLTTEIPSFRPDLEREVDLIEEIGRLNGLDKIPSTMPKAVAGYSDFDRIYDRLAKVRATLTGLGFTEACHQTFTNEVEDGIHQLSSGESRLKLLNPLSEEMPVLRSSLYPNLLSSLRTNVTRGTADVSLFEIGRVFWSDSQGMKETTRIGLGWVGNSAAAHWSVKNASPVEFADVKGMVETFFQHLNLRDWQFAAVEAGGEDSLFILSAQILLRNRRIGTIGQVHPRHVKHYDLKGSVLLAEMDLEPLLNAWPVKRALQELPQYPAVQRDIALVVDEKVPHGAIIKIFQKTQNKYLERVELFDIFRSETIGRSRKSMAYSLTYRAEDKTLTDAEVNQAHAQIKAKLASELGAEVRE